VKVRSRRFSPACAGNE